MSTLKKSATTGFLWSGIEHFSNFGLRFLVQIILARLLLPDEFGLVALVLVFSKISIGLMDLGLTQVVIQKPEIDQEDYDTIFYTNLAIGIFLTFALYVTAPWIAHFYSQPELVLITRVLSITIMTNAICRIHLSRLMREMKYRQISYATIAARLVAAAVAITMAYRGYGVWALVCFSVCAATLECIGYWQVSKWRPSINFSITRLKQMLPFGTQMSAVRVINLMAENMYVLVIGKIYNPAQVGYYQRAGTLRKVAADELLIVIERITFPVLSRLQDNKKRFAMTFGRLLVVQAVVFSAILTSVAIVAKPLIIVLIGEQWLPSVPYLQIMCFIGWLYVVHRSFSIGIKALGCSRQLLTYTFFEHGLQLLLLIVTLRFGIIAILFGQAIAMATALMPKVYFLTKRVNLDSKSLVYSSVASIVLSMLVIGVSLGIRNVTPTPILVLFTNFAVLLIVIACAMATLAKVYRYSLFSDLSFLPVKKCRDKFQI